MIKKALSFTLHNCYCAVRGEVFRKIIGITMELRPVQIFVHCFFRFNDLIYARKFCKAFRLIDAQDVLNCCEEFEQCISE